VTFRDQNVGSNDKDGNHNVSNYGYLQLCTVISMFCIHVLFI